MQVKSDEELLEPLARAWRFWRGFQVLPRDKAVTVVDLGCGPKARFYFYARQRGLQIKKYYGVDPLLSKTQQRWLESQGPITTVVKKIAQKVAVADSSADVVVGFAVLEHVDHPEAFVAEALRMLKPGGVAVFTTPSPAAQRILEFLSFKLKLISPREIEEHQRYFTAESLWALVPARYRSRTTHTYFEWGWNNLLVIRK